MASTSRTLCRSFLCISRITPAKRKCLSPFQPQHRSSSNSTNHATDRNGLPKPWLRNFDTTLRDAGMNEVNVSPEVAEELRPLYDPQPDEYLVPATPLTPSDLLPDERADYEALPEDQKADYLGKLNHFKRLSETIPPDTDDPSSEDFVSEEEMERLEKRMHRELPFDVNIPKANSAKKGMGMWAEDEADEMAQYPDEDNEDDDSMMSGIAEGELQHHRGIRKYTRAVAWEMPLLGKFARPLLHPPTHHTPLRFRHTTHLGESHPSSRKIVLEFSSHDLLKSLSLTEPQRIKLTKLLGPRYNHLTDIAKLSCEKFENQAQNKRYLGDLLGVLIKEAKEGKDAFEDVPLDTRHTRGKETHRFPERWFLTGERVRELGEGRKKSGEKALGAPGGEGEEMVGGRGGEAQQRVQEYVRRMPLGVGREREREREAVRVR